MNARELEDHLMARCVAVAKATADGACDEREANVFRVASMVLRSRFPNEASSLWTASARYFDEYPMQQRHAEEVVRAGWIISLPRLRDTLTVLLRPNARS